MVARAGLNLRNTILGLYFILYVCVDTVLIRQEVVLR